MLLLLLLLMPPKLVVVVLSWSAGRLGQRRGGLVKVLQKRRAPHREMAGDGRRMQAGELGSLLGAECVRDNTEVEVGG